MEKVSTNTDQVRNKPSENEASINKPSLSSPMSQGNASVEHDKYHGIQSLGKAKEKLHDLEHSMRTKGLEASKAGRDYILQNPFKSVLVASAAGMVLGFLFTVFRK